MSDRERDSIQEMEDIQKGLEAFLQQEMQEMQTSGSGRGKSGTGRRTAERPAPQMFDMTEDDEDEEELGIGWYDRWNDGRSKTHGGNSYQSDG